ncbi:MAG TPA: alpha-ketoglutarate-dependent dioxygenase AlkB [Chitinophagaceae bacterium]|nr:alpha-ketoglutarate-dependent dioxygenase AlkB [Chitinophagaceae bacterium]
MSTLFPVEPAYPEGFQYFPDFISASEETALYKEATAIELKTFTFQGFEAKRRVASFGYDYSFDKGQLLKGKEIPQAFHALIEKVGSKLSVPTHEFAELLVTEYPVGSVINWHRDAPPFDLIAGISLMSDCIFKLRPYEKSKQGRNVVIAFPVKRRSLYVIHGPARTDWQHSIAPVKHIRYSITLRTLKGYIRD